VSLNLLMSACCCGEINCPEWQNCRPQTASVSTSGALSYGFRDDGFTMSRDVLNWQIAFDTFRNPGNVGMFGQPPTSFSLDFARTRYDYSSGGVQLDPNCPACKSRRLAYTLTGSATILPNITYGGIGCYDPCLGLGDNAFSGVAIGGTVSVSFTETRYSITGIPSVINGNGSGTLSIELIGKEGCLTSQSFDDYRVRQVKLAMNIAGNAVNIESNPNFDQVSPFVQCDCSSGCLPPALECIGFGSQNIGRLNPGQGWSRETCVDAFSGCVEQVCINPVNGETLSVCGCQTENSPYGPIGDNLDGLALRVFFEDLETALQVGVP
jgi:hypothetical protein